MLFNVLTVLTHTAMMQFEKGWSEAQMMEAVHVACAIRGGASLVHGVQMMNKVKEIAM